MNYHPNYKRNYPWKILIFLGLVLVSFFLFANQSRVSPALSDLGRNFWRARVRVIDFLNPHEESGELENLKTALDFVLLENQLLKEYLGKTSQLPYLLTTILARPPQIPYDTLILDAGREDLVEAGDLVLAYPNIALGRVTEVGEKSSRAVLFSSSDQKINVLVGTSDFLAAQASGVGGGNFILRLPQEFIVATGTIVSLPQSESYILGRVAKVEEKSEGPSQLVRFSSLINTNQLKWVFLVK